MALDVWMLSLSENFTVVFNIYSMNLSCVQESGLAVLMGYVHVSLILWRENVLTVPMGVLLQCLFRGGFTLFAYPRIVSSLCITQEYDTCNRELYALVAFPRVLSLLRGASLSSYHDRI